MGQEVSTKASAARLADYIEKSELQPVKLPREFSYASLPLCVIDAVYSIGVRYTSVEATIDRFAAKTGWRVSTGQSDARENGEHTMEDLLNILDQTSPENAADTLFGNRQRTSPRSGILKAEAVQLFARELIKAGINDFGDIDDVSLADAKTGILGVRGQGSGISFDYFRMLAGDDEVIKPDRMVQRFVVRALGLEEKDMTIELTIELVHRTVRELARRRLNWSPRRLDYAIWARESGTIP